MHFHTQIFLFDNVVQDKAQEQTALLIWKRHFEHFMGPEA
jgi:hypothetical protein